MVNIKKGKTVGLILLLAALIIGLACVPAFGAEEGSPGWRPVYDYIMRWINFGILAYLIFRYGRRPLKMFLQGQSDEVSKEINSVETQKQQIQEQINETHKQIQASSDRFSKIKSRIIEEGERLKQSIVDDAREQGKNMLEREKKKAARRLVEARNQFMAELVDAATKTAQERLPGEITDDDHRKMLDHYMANVDQMATE